MEKGYDDVLIYRPGIIGWAKSGLQLEYNTQYPDVKIELISSQDLAAAPQAFQIIDIRPTSHFEKGHIAGAKNIDLEDLHERYSELVGMERVLLVDHKGKLTLTAGKYLVSKGVTSVYRLDGGFNAWVKKGHKISRK